MYSSDSVTSSVGSKADRPWTGQISHVYARRRCCVAAYEGAALLTHKCDLAQIGLSSHGLGP